MNLNEVASLLSFDINPLWRHIRVRDETWERFENVDAFNNVSSSDASDKQSWNNRLIY